VRQQQLALLLELVRSHRQLAPKLTAARNNNGSTPLIVAASGIRNPQDVEVFRLLLNAADACVLATSTKSGRHLIWLQLLHVHSAFSRAYNLSGLGGDGG
jgi:hypothetical protein